VRTKDKNRLERRRMESVVLDLGKSPASSGHKTKTAWREETEERGREDGPRRWYRELNHPASKDEPQSSGRITMTR
jgi:hypothetical protein